MFRSISYALLTLAILTLVASTSVAQEIRGTVRYMETGQPVMEAHVRCSGTGGISSQMTDRTGKFYFRVSPGQYDVSAQLPGYQEEVRSVSVLDTGSSEFVDFRLKPESSSGNKNVKPTTIDVNVPIAAQKEFDKGEAALATGKKEGIEEAIPHYLRAVEIYPKFIQAQLKVGTAYMDLQDWNKAEQALKKALEIDPKAVNASFALGELYLRQKKYDEAEKALQAGLSTESNSARAHYALARVYWEKFAGVKEEAQWRPALEKSYEEVKQALELNPNLAEAHLLKGNLYFKVRRAADAQHEYEEYLRLDPKGQEADQTRALVERIKKALAEQKKP